MPHIIYELTAPRTPAKPSSLRVADRIALAWAGFICLIVLMMHQFNISNFLNDMLSENGGMKLMLYLVLPVWLLLKLCSGPRQP